VSRLSRFGFIPPLVDTVTPTDSEIIPSVENTQTDLFSGPSLDAPLQLITFSSKQHLGHPMAKVNVRVRGTDNVVIDFRSTGEQDLRASEGKPVVATGSAKDRTAVVHGNVPGSSILIDNPA
jgi:hypothetical protein